MWGCGVIAEVVAWRKSRRMEERCVLCCVVSRVFYLILRQAKGCTCLYVFFSSFIPFLDYAFMCNEILLVHCVWW